MAQLTVKEAVQRATDILKDLYEGQELKYLLLEEIEKGAGGTWYVTLGFTRPGTIGVNMVGGVASPPSNRLYKRIKINAETGEFQGMTDRLLEEVGP